MNEIFTKRVTVDDDILMQELEDEAVILDLNSENYFSLDDVGTRMWQLFTSNETIQDAYDHLLAEYDAPPETLKKDLIDFVQRLEQKGLISIE